MVRSRVATTEAGTYKIGEAILRRSAAQPPSVVERYASGGKRIFRLTPNRPVKYVAFRVPQLRGSPPGDHGVVIGVTPLEPNWP